MGCFLSCFRGGSVPSSDLRDPLVRDSRLGDAFLSDEKKFDGATRKLDVETAPDGHGIDEELLREAHYLKSCGAISQTPPEILDSIPINSEHADGCGGTETSLHLMKDTVLLEENSPELLNSDEHDVSKHEHDIDEGTLRVGSEPQSSLEDKPEQDIDEGTLRVGSEPQSSLEDKPEQDIDEGTLMVGSETQSSLEDMPQQDIDEGTLRVGSETQSSSEVKPLCQNVRDQSTDSSDSPYPTPLVLRGDIQTPGTVYSAYMETSKPGKRTRASRQFIYPVLRPIENKMQWMELKAESPVLSSNPPKRRNLSADSSEKAQQTFASSTVTETEEFSDYVSFPVYDNSATQNEVMSPDEPKCQNEDIWKQSSEYEKHEATSLSYWLKPSSADDERSNDPDGNVGKETRYETSLSDVPIFTAFGLNWETDMPTPVLPKAWDGNGIPNTTTKYKEDQKVNWHATPFEERLLKVLSDDKPRHEMKFSGKLIHLEENSE